MNNDGTRRGYTMIGEYERRFQKEITRQDTGQTYLQTKLIFTVNLKRKKTDEVWVTVPEGMEPPELEPEVHYGVPVIIETSGKSSAIWHTLRQDMPIERISEGNSLAA